MDRAGTPIGRSDESVEQRVGPATKVVVHPSALGLQNRVMQQAQQYLEDNVKAWIAPQAIRTVSILHLHSQFVIHIIILAM